MKKTSIIHTFSWETFDHLIMTLAEKIQGDGCPEVIVGLQRGGLIPSVQLAHLLAIPELLPLSIRSTTSDEINADKHPPKFATQSMDDLFAQITNKDILVVDDIVGSGATLRESLRILSPYPSKIRSVAAIVNHEHWDPVNQQEVATVITYIGKELWGWVVFPWERKIQ